MADRDSLRVVIDTNVIFEGLTKKGGAAGMIVDAWLAGLYKPCISSSLAYEYVDVLSRRLSEKRWVRIQPVLAELLSRAIFVAINFSWRPNSPDPGDDHVIDCGMNAGAIVVTSNLKDYRMAETNLGLRVMDPIEFLNYLLEYLE